MAKKAFPEACLEEIIERAVREGLLFELLFSENSKRLLEGFPQEKVREIILKKLGIDKRKIKEED